MKPKKNIKEIITAVVANRNGQIFELEGYGAAGMSRSSIKPLLIKDTTPLPFGSELMLLPDRKPILFNMEKRRIEILDENPYNPGEPIFPVSAFNSPGYVVSFNPAYAENKNAQKLPLFSYGAVGWAKGGFYSAAICVDKEKRQDLRFMKQKDVMAGIKSMRKKMPKNRLRAHLETCALKYGCPAGKNFFLSRFEAPLPTARLCNARCIGCISLQSGDNIKSCQERISFTPTPEEIAKIALSHINQVQKPIVSFGQGCEGDPLLAAKSIEPAIRLIRSKTRKGTINLNTNGSLPHIMKTLFDAGLDSVRISLNSVRHEFYDAYYRPKGYGFSDVVKGIDLAGQLGKFVSVNYLNCPGFTDSQEEVDALRKFLAKHPINMIQWRNLNFDPVEYLRIMADAGQIGKPVGMNRLLLLIKKSFPKIIYGYFNPPKERFNFDE